LAFAFAVAFVRAVAFVFWLSSFAEGGGSAFAVVIAFVIAVASSFVCHSAA
jgi:hypothetical protein